MPAPRTPTTRGRLFRQIITAHLSRARRTPRGRIVPYDGDEGVVLGTPGGPHTPVETPWLYEEAGSSRCLLFGFYSGRNGRGHDLICKVLPSLEGYRPKVGASLQLNAERTLEDDGDHVRLFHHGDVSRPCRIAHDLLAELIQEYAPREARALGVVFSPGSWPLQLGSTRTPAHLLDRLFLYAWCIQAAKDAYTYLNAADPDVPPRANGQGHISDPQVRQAVEEFAMKQVEAHYITEGYSLDDVHKTPGMLDFKCVKDGREIRVEVKGTMSEGKSVELTASEYNHASRGDPPVHLAVVSSIRIEYIDGVPRASGGALRIYCDFDPAEHDARPTRYRCTLDHTRGGRLIRLS